MSAGFWPAAGQAVCALIAAAALWRAFQVDLRRLIIPDGCVVAVAATGLAQAFLFPLAPFDDLGRPFGLPLDHLLGAALLGGLFWAIDLAYAPIAGRTAIGFGDVKLGFAGGLWISWQGVPFFLLLSALAASGVYCWLAWARGRRGRRPPRVYPFGPGLCAGFVLVAGFAAGGEPVGLMGPDPVAELLLGLYQ